ncbi:WRKY transcription factor 55 [Abeliophyllum distichum]|uniref:WRKY transcription factor 55 n=1 Tax=Abeliophyllum distichum TaxID=126358 RepID=A0ABD1UP69_9LAMI
MEETRGSILYGCKLAKNLEENLPNLANQPDFFLRSCDEIIRVFSSIKERLSHEVDHRQFDMGVGIQEWLRSAAGTSDHQAMDLLHAQAILGQSSAYQDTHGLEFIGHEMGGGRNVEGGAEGLRGGTGLEIKPMDALNATPSPGTSSSQRHRRRKNEADKIVKRVPAPQMGNLDLPPEDGFTWRKYGQKEILGCRHPRSYYRCTHQKLYECPAKKQVQRLNDDFYTFEVTYRGNHTCNIASTAPSATIPPPMEHATIPQTTAMQPPTSHWLSMEIKPSPEVEATPTIFDTLAFRYPGIPGGAGPSSSGSVAAGGSGSAGPSGPRFPDYQPVADLADAMFNSGSSSNNSMEPLLFIHR